MIGWLDPIMARWRCG